MRFPRALAMTSVLTLSALALVGVGISSANAMEQASIGSQPLADANSASDGGVAAKIASEYDHPVVVEDSLTPTTQIEALPDGSWRYSSASQPVRVETSSGWEDIDSTLVLGQDGYLTQRAATVPVEFSSGGSGYLARVQSSTGQWLSESWTLGELPAPTVSGSTATYASVLPGVDLQLTAADTGMSSVIVVRNAAAAADPRLDSLKVLLHGGVASTDTDGNLSVRLTDGSTVLAAAPTWWDSSDSESGATGPASAEIAQPLDSIASGSSITLDTTDATDAQGVEYPLYIDPDWQQFPGDASHAWYVDQAYPTQNYLDDGPYTSDYERVGYIDAANSPDSRNHLTRAFYYVSTPTLANPNIVIRTSTATFTVKEVGAYNCTASGVKLYRVTGALTTDTWNSAADVSWAQGQDTQTVAHGASGCASANVEFDATNAAAYIRDNGSSRIYFGLRASSETSNSGYKKFSKTATFSVEYDTLPVVQSFGFNSASTSCGTSSSPTYVSAASGITLQSKVSDADKSTNLQTTFHLLDASSNEISTGWTTSASSNGSTPSTPILQSYRATGLPTPADGLYQLSATVFDGLYTSVVVPSCFYFLDSTPPAVPSFDSATTMSATAVGVGLTAKFQANDSDTSQFGYYWVPGPPASAATVVPLDGSLTTTPVVGGGLSAAIQVAPIDTDSTLVVVALDKAGNVSSTTSGGVTSHAITQEFANVANDTNVRYSAGHSWFLESAIPATSIADTNVTSGSATTSAAPLTATTGTSGNFSTDTPKGPSSTVFVAGTGSAAIHTAHAALDIAHSFTVGAWVRPSTVTSTGQFTILSQAGASTAATNFSLGISNGQWEFCLGSLNAATTANLTPDGCVTASSLTPTAGSSAYVTGEWDAVNQQVRLFVGPSLLSSRHAAAPSAAQGNFYVASDWVGSAPTKRWAGTIDDPSALAGIVSTGQLTQLRTLNPVS